MCPIFLCFSSRGGVGVDGKDGFKRRIIYIMYSCLWQRIHNISTGKHHCLWQRIHNIKTSELLATYTSVFVWHKAAIVFLRNNLLFWRRMWPSLCGVGLPIDFQRAELAIIWFGKFCWLKIDLGLKGWFVMRWRPGPFSG